MVTIRFYEKGLTRENRFLDQNALSSFLYNNISFTISVDGCPITNTSSYVDFQKLPPNSDSLLHRITYMLINDGVNNYLCFVDRVEPNNFNLDAKYFRVYYTVDWWSTIMFNSSPEDYSDLLSKIEGNVFRAHVNDIARLGSEFRQINTYTTREAECGVSKLRNEITTYLSASNNESNYNSDTRYIWCLCANEGEQNILKKFKVGYRTVEYAYDLYIIPTKEQELVTYLDGERVGSVRVGGNGIGIADIDDSKVILMYGSTLCPFNDGTSIRFDFNNINEEQAQPTNFVKEFSTISNTGGLLDAWVKAFRIPTFISNPDIHFRFELPNLRTVYNRTVEIPTTYAEYLNTCVSKYNYSPYRSSYIICDGQSVEIYGDMILGITYAVDFCVLPELGGTMCYINYSYDATNNGDYNYRVISSGYSMPPLSINDEFTATTRSVLSMNALGNTIKSMADLSTFKGVDSINPISIASTAGNALTFGAMMDNVSNINKKSKIFGENGLNINPSSLTTYINPLMFVTYTPIEDDDNRILADLALYGYTTYLHPHDILLNHKRKYFNYIKMNNTKVLSTLYTTEVRLQIEEMFNNGVWLWSDYAKFGNYKVPNYPILMDGN